MTDHRSRGFDRSRGVFGLLLVVLGAWGALVPFVGPYVDFGFASDETWRISQQHLLLRLVPGLVAAAAGVFLLAGTRTGGTLAAAVAAAAGIWYIVGPSVYPLWSAGLDAPSGSERTEAALWIGYFYGVGALIVYVAALAQRARPRSTLVAADDRVTDSRASHTPTPVASRRRTIYRAP